MKKNAIVIVKNLKGEKFLTDIIEIFPEKGKAVVSYYGVDECEKISNQVKELLGVSVKWDTTIVSIDDIEEVVSGEVAEKIHPDGDVTLDMPGFTISFNKPEHLYMFEEFVFKFDARFELMMSSPSKMEIYFVNNWFDKLPTQLEKRMLVTAFKDAINLSYVPKIEEGLIEFISPEVCSLSVEDAKYIRKQ